MKAIIELDVPEFQIGQEVSIYFKDTMTIKGIVQEPKTGHWIYIDEKKAKCSECGYIQITGGKDKTGHCNIHYAIYKYCTNCGAKMLKPQESEGKDADSD